MRVLGIDPGSVRTGYALIDSVAGTLVQVGVIRPNPGRPVERVEQLVDELETVLADLRPDLIVVEVTTGKVARRGRAGGGAGLGVYGMAVGAVYITARRFAGAETVGVYENDWTQGVPKSKRLGQIALAFPELVRSKAFQDADIADAVGVALYHLQQQAREVLAG